MSIIRKITGTASIVIAAAAAAAPTALAGTPAQSAGAKQVREVCAQTYVKKRPGSIVAGTVYKGDKVEVRRHSESGDWAYVVFKRFDYTGKGWLLVSDLCARGRSAEFAKTSRYSVKIANSPVGGDPGFFYVGGPVNITVTDKQRAGQRLTLCVAPAPEQQPACRAGTTGRTLSTIVWAKPVPTEVKISIDGGPTLTDTVRPWAARRTPR